VSEAVKPSTTTQATSEATPAAPRKRGRPKKERPEAAQTSLFTQSASEDSGELSDDPKAPNYRFRNLLTNGKAKTFEGMKISEAINGEEVICLICGVHQNMIKKHLRARHNMSGEQYLTHFGIDPADEKSKDFLRGPGFGNRKSDETKASGFGKHERPAKAAVVEQPKTKARAKKATPTPATEMKKTRGRAKATA
jgi:predicted transcriptional regulator